MRLLLDADVLIWWATDNRRLGRDAAAAIADADNEVRVSAATIWEIEIKRASGKLQFDRDLAEPAQDAGLKPLDVTFAHAVDAGRLPRVHGDPFDRMLIAQAVIEGLSIVTSDRIFACYPVSVLPA